MAKAGMHAPYLAHRLQISFSERRRQMLYDVTQIGLAGARKLLELDFVTNNVANSATAGFKAEHLYYAMQGKNVDQGVAPGLGHTVSAIDFSQGTLQTTGNILDLAIEGDGFFTIQTKKGTAYTREGSFILNKNKELVTPQGDYVLGDGGKIIIDGTSVTINQEGMIYVDENPVGKIKVTAFEKPQKLARSADGKYIDRDGAGAKKTADYRVNSGYLEMSNVNAVREMTDMINIQRTFETYQKIIFTLQDMDKISTNRIGKLV